MTRLFLIIVFISASFCGINAQDKKGPGVKTEGDAVAVLSYTKAIAEITDAYGKALTKVDTVLMAVIENIQIAQKKVAGKPSLIDCSVLNFDKQITAQYQSQIKSGPDFPKKNEIIENMNKSMFYYNQIVADCNNFSKYFSKESYKNDEGYKIYLGIFDTINRNIKWVHVHLAQTSILSEAVQESANMEILQNSPIGEFAVPMYNNLKLLGELFKMYSMEFVDINNVTSISNAIQNSIYQNKSANGKDLNKLSNPSYKDLYDSFYNNLQTSLFLIRNALEKKDVISSPDIVPIDIMGDKTEKEENLILKKDRNSINTNGMEEDYAQARVAYHIASGEYQEFVKQ